MTVQKNAWNVKAGRRFYLHKEPPKDSQMKKLLVSIATAGLLLSAGVAYSQNPSAQRDAPSQTSPAQPGQAAPSTGGQTQTAPTQRNGASPQTGERRGGREGMRGREGSDRDGVRVRIGRDRDGYRQRGGYRYSDYGSRCRTIIVRTHRHGRTIIQRVRRCR
jgi:hypothetical protein